LHIPARRKFLVVGQQEKSSTQILQVCFNLEGS
jgi:hypothetical protein